MENNEIKQKLYDFCLNYLDERIELELKTIENARIAANNESKCCVGDKYETTRAMMHLEQEKYSRQLNQTLELKQSLLQIDINKVSKVVIPGSLVITDVDNFFFTISAGELELDGIEYVTLSLLSPLGQAFAQKSVGETIAFRGMNYTVRSIV